MSTIQQPSTRSATGVRHYVSLDSLRGIFAVMVVLYHMPASGALVALPFVRNASLYVDFFFVLSGFVIAASYGDRLAQGFSIPRFMTLRLGRVYPLHLAILLAFLAMEIAALVIGRGHGARPPFTDTRTPIGLVTGLTLTQIFGFEHKVSWNSPSWSIAAEVWTYLLAAVGLSLTRRRFPLLLAIVAAAVPIHLALVDGQGLDRTYSMALERCVYGFALGMFAHMAHRRFGDAVPSGLYKALEALLAVVLIVAVGMAVPGRTTLLFPPLFAFAVFVFANDHGPVSRALAAKPMRTLGALSYSIYMVHILVLGRVLDVTGLAGRILHRDLVAMMWKDGGMTKGFTGTGLQPDLLTVMCVAVVVAVSWCTYRWIEIPFRNMSRDLSKRMVSPSGIVPIPKATAGR